VVVSYISRDGIIVSSDSPSKPPVQLSGSTIVAYLQKIHFEWNFLKDMPKNILHILVILGGYILSGVIGNAAYAGLKNCFLI
jgi:hypothetical protein